jgi:hypothetical protein
MRWAVLLGVLVVATCGSAETGASRGAPVVVVVGAGAVRVVID